MPENEIQSGPASANVDAAFAEAMEKLKDRLRDDIWFGLLTRGAAVLVFAFLIGLFTFAAFTRVPVMVSDLLTRLFLN